MNSTSPEMGTTWVASLASASVAMAADGQLCYTNSFKKVSGLFFLPLSRVKYLSTNIGLSTKER